MKKGGKKHTKLLKKVQKGVQNEISVILNENETKDGEFGIDDEKKKTNSSKASSIILGDNDICNTNRDVIAHSR